MAWAAPFTSVLAAVQISADLSRAERQCCGAPDRAPDRNRACAFKCIIEPDVFEPDAAQHEDLIVPKSAAVGMPGAEGFGHSVRCTKGPCGLSTVTNRQMDHNNVVLTTPELVTFEAGRSGAPLHRAFRRVHDTGADRISVK